MAAQRQPPDHLPVPRFGHVRGVVWGLLIASLLVALSLPLLTLWHSASSPLSAHVCLWPPQPQDHQMVRLVVSVPDAADQNALAGPWAHLHIAWDMVTMPMDIHPIDLAGTAEQDGAFSVPLQVDMPGSWQIALTLQTPGRPEWQTQVKFTVASSAGTLAEQAGAPGGASSAGCTVAMQERTSSL